MNFAHPESLIFWTILLFLISLFLLKKFAWKPILSAIKEREESINEALESAERAKKEMANLKADNEKLLQEARQERDAILKEARQIKEDLISKAKEEAKQEADKIISQTHNLLQDEKKATILELKDYTAKLSLEIAQKVVSTELSSKENQEKLIEKLLNEVKLK